MTSQVRSYLIYLIGWYLLLHLIPSTIGRFHP